MISMNTCAILLVTVIYSATAKSTSRCTLPKDPGPCRGFFPRFYYNIHSKKCEQFIYGGCQGNANNFQSIDECRKVCEVTTSKCTLPKDPGPCKAAFPRFYYNKHTGKCEKFIYGGCQGNANNFITIHECINECGGTSSICDLPKVSGPCLAYFPRYYFNKAAGKCQKFIYGGCQGNANNFETLQECKNKCKAKSTCDLPKDVGPCDAIVPRFFYNKKTGDCEPFNFGGCEGNSNNFKTIDTCRARCVSSSPCNLPKVVGPCEALIPRYYYNSKKARCQKFNYGGCDGNSNNFETLAECRKKCQCSVNIISVKLGRANFNGGGSRSTRREPPTCGRSRCCLPKVQGPCYANFQRYYFNKEVRQCQLFTYGGCLGNGNNFKTLLECQTICKRY